MNCTLRIGQGWDVHQLVPGRKLILCGVSIPHPLGLLGHSDADVAVHALMDALLGALALGDIGHLFPDNDPAYKDADSIQLLQKMLRLPPFRSWQLVNADLTIMAQKPKIAPYIKEMQQNLASAMDCSPEQISVKATTTEKLGFCGREEGIAASAVVLLTQI